VAHPGGPLTAPEEPVRQERPSPNARGLSAVTRYGFTRFCDLFNPRQLLSLLSFSKQVRSAYATMVETGYTVEQAKAITAYLGILVNRVADYNSAFCSWHNTREVIGHTFARQALPMIWDFVEVNPLGDASGNAFSALDWIVGFIQSNHTLGMPANTQRTSATSLPYQAETFDAIVTDPPYYDNVPYSDLSDFFYVWLKRSIGFIFPEHFSSFLGPKKKEAIMDTGRYGDENAARSLYEELMAQAFAEAGRTLKPGAPLVIVYAHKTTLGWATLVDALRVARFTVTEAWPLDTEMGARLLAMGSAALASSIFLVARRREGDITGSYEREVRPDLEQIVRERVERLWAQGVTGADLVIACVGAGLRAFTRYARVEYANGEQVPADTFLAEVEGVVLETLLEKLFGVDRTGISSVDRVTRFYVLWRFAYRHAAIDAGEAIVFAYPQRVELDGPGGLSSGSHPLVEKQRSKYYLRDFAERGDDEDLGKPHTGETAPLIDVLHRVLWLVENAPHQIPAYLDEARPDIERLRIVAQTLAGQTLAGNGSGGGKSLVAATGAEAAALRKLTTNWRTLIEERRSGLL
jgi:putative DNA methylase